MSDNKNEILAGGCLCSGVRYQITGQRRNVVNCHCQNCRRTHGHFAAYTSVHQSNLVMISQQTLQWYHDKSPNTYRGFCNRCGASLFWDARDGRNKMAVAAGTLDDSCELKTIGHVYLSEAGRYYEINDGLPRFDTSGAGTLECDEDG